MAAYAAFLSGGSQIGPVIAGYLIEARGWRWFCILCAILAAVNLVTTFFMLPETIYEREDEEFQETNEGSEKHAESQLEHIQSQSQVGDRAKMDYGVYFRGLFTMGITAEAKENGVFKHFLYLLVLPAPLLLVPGVLIASIMYGVILGGYVNLTANQEPLFPPPSSPPPQQAHLNSLTL